MQTEAVKKWLKALYEAGYCFSPSPAYFHWANLVNPKGDKKAAEEAYQLLLEDEPENLAGLEGLAYLVQIQGRIPEAIELKKRHVDVSIKALDIPRKEIRRERSFQYAMKGLAPAPKTAPESLIKRNFDNAADGFDDQLSNKVEYQGPQVFNSKVSEIYAEGNTAATAIDLGCGTGLVGEVIRPFCARLTGVDLSEGMLAKAGERRCYDELICSDISSYLNKHEQSYDLIIAADVFIYIGDLSQVLQRIGNRLAPGGWLLFSCELDDDQDYLLHHTGRYSHSTGYLTKLVTDNNCSIKAADQISLRKELGAEVPFIVITAQRD